MPGAVSNVASSVQCCIVCSAVSNAVYNDVCGAALSLVVHSYSLLCVCCICLMLCLLMGSCDTYHKSHH